MLLIFFTADWNFFRADIDLFWVWVVSSECCLGLDTSNYEEIVLAADFDLCFTWSGLATWESPAVILKVERRPYSSFDLPVCWVSAIVCFVFEGFVMVLLMRKDLPRWVSEVTFLNDSLYLLTS